MAPESVHILYDGRCEFCRANRRLLERLGGDTFRFVDIHDPAAMGRFPELSADRAAGQMHLVDSDGRVFGGYEAVMEAAQRLPRYALLARLLRTPLLRRIGPSAYRWIARHRHAFFRRPCRDACPLPP